MGVALGLLLTTVVCQALAQSLHPTPHTPELFGIYPGMPESEARAQLQKLSSTIYVKSDARPELGFGLMISDPKNPDQIAVSLTQLPNPSLVWRIQRTQTYNPGAGGPPLSQEVVLGALREKYGKETMTSDRVGALYIFWLFDQNGKLLSAPDPTLQGCDGGEFLTYIQSGPPQVPNTTQQACYKSFYAVKAMFNRMDAQRLNAYSLELVNLPFAYRAAMNTLNATNDAAAKAKQDEIKPVKPKL